jgi:Zn ribbon nucleic-acid-binding protein
VNASRAPSAQVVASESPAEHLRNALQILAPTLADYASRGDDPAVLVALEDVGHLCQAAARRIRRAIDQLEQRDGPACPTCTAHHTPSVMIADGPVLRCVWCGYEVPATALKVGL